MFGYVTVNKDELKIREWNRYRAYYCGLCHSLKETAGTKARLTVSYDMTFLTMLLDDLYDCEKREGQRRCVVHPVKKQLMLSNNALDYCADVSALISYYDLRDGWEDERRVDRLAESALLRSAALRAGERLERQRRAVADYVEKLHEVERSNDANLDAAANLTGELMAELLVMKPGLYERDLREMGFYLGKFIYLCDCYEDIERDIKKKSYNPLIERSKSPQFEEDCRAMLGDMMARAALAFERLPVIEDAEIMRNILYSGIWQRFEHASEQRKAKQEQ